MGLLLVFWLKLFLLSPNHFLPSICFTSSFLSPVLLCYLLRKCASYFVTSWSVSLELWLCFLSPHAIFHPCLTAILTLFNEKYFSSFLIELSPFSHRDSDFIKLLNLLNSKEKYQQKNSSYSNVKNNSYK